MPTLRIASERMRFLRLLTTEGNGLRAIPNPPSTDPAHDDSGRVRQHTFGTAHRPFPTVKFGLVQPTGKSMVEYADSSPFAHIQAGFQSGFADGMSKPIPYGSYGGKYTHFIPSSGYSQGRNFVIE